jgi:tetratricopeptide (TPR) repeat protein
MHDQDRRRPALPARLAPAEREFFVELRRLLDAAGLSARDLASPKADAASWQGWIDGKSLPPQQAVTDLGSRLARNGTGTARLIRLRSRVAVPTSYPAASVQSAGRPRQLPAETGGFTGRADDLKILERLARQAAGVTDPVIASANSGPADDGPTVIVLQGPAGVGKTALAVHAAHRLSDLFPAGQLWAGLRDSAGAGDPVSDSQALHGFLEALGVAPGNVPKDTDEQAALYRSLLAGRQALVVLDDARDASQIRRLIPAGRGCLVLVTTRAIALTMPNAPVHLLRVGPLREWEAHDLLEQRLPAERIRSDPAAVDDLVRLCGRLPLPLGVAAARAAADPDLPLRALAAVLRSGAGGGTGDAGGGTEDGTADPVTTARRIFAASYARLSDGAAQMFRLLSVCPGPGISVPAAASLAAIAPGQARGALDELTAMRLIEEHQPGRFIIHGLLREFAAGQARANEGRSALDAAGRRLLDHYLRSMHAAMCMLYPESRPVRLVPPVPGVAPESLSHSQSLEWWQAERLVLRSLVAYAAERRDLGGYCWQLAWAMGPLLVRGGLFHDYLAIQETAIAAAERLGDPLGQGIAHYGYAHACALLGQTGDSGAHLKQALDWFARAGDQVGAAASLDGLAQLLMQEGDYPQALERAKEALETRRVIGLPDGIAHSEHTLGSICARLGRHDEAARHCQRSLDLSRETGSRAHTADALSTLGSVHLSLGAYDRAVACYMEVLATCRLIGDNVQTAQALTGLGDAQHAKGNGRAASDAWRQALSILSGLPNADIEPLQARLDGIPL